MKTRNNRQEHYLVKLESLNAPNSKKVRHPKGSKTKKKYKSSYKKKYERKGLFKLFDKVKKFFLRIDSYRKMIE
ncbi:MAG: hypothetical protein ACTSRP_19775 [Candidatus Helarchaeota archaeon]